MLRSEAIVQRARWRVAALPLKLNCLRFSLALRAYNPQQPRVPAGSSDGGQWTDEGGGDSDARQDDDRIIRVSDEETRRYSVILSEEEARGGHTIREHVGKTDQEMLERVLASRRESLFHAYGRRRVGSFESIEFANNYVNRTLEFNQAGVNQVTTGREDSAFIV
ncbi:RNase A-like domain-containing protein [Methylorubrum populi]